MLIARGGMRLHDAVLKWSVVFGRGAWSLVVDREGLVLDTRFVPAEAGAPRGKICVYAVVDGRWEVHGEPQHTFVGPAAFLVRESHLEGADGRRPYDFRASGEAFSAAQIYFSESDVLREVGDRPVRIDLDASTMASVRQAVASVRNVADDAPLRSAMERVLADLVDLKIVKPDVAVRSITDAPVFERLWTAVRPMVERFYLSPSLKDVSSASGFSARTAERHISNFLNTFGFAGTGWRTASRHLRLKLAALLLSAKGASIADVAGKVGYGSPEAMARAFRDARLPAPSAIQDALLAGR